MSKMIKIVSWNVNGIRAATRNGFVKWLREEQPDILCLQETKAEKDQLSDEILYHEGYESFWNSCMRKKGYSGTAIFSKYRPQAVDCSLDDEERFDIEGRTMIADFEDFVLYNIYFPNGKASEERLKFKLDFYEAFQKKAEQQVKKGKKLLICGDFNTAHHEIDLARPKENENISGFLPVERAWMDRFEEAGFYDTLRLFDQRPGLYSWWSVRSRARERNVGWRIDYFFVSKNLKSSVKNAWIMPDVKGSDHCPVAVELEVSPAFLSKKIYC